MPNPINVAHQCEFKLAINESTFTSKKNKDTHSKKFVTIAGRIFRHKSHLEKEVRRQIEVRSLDQMFIFDLLSSHPTRAEQLVASDGTARHIIIKISPYRQPALFIEGNEEPISWKKSVKIH